MLRRYACALALGLTLWTMVGQADSSALKDGWAPKFYYGLEAVGSVKWVPKAYKEKVGALNFAWESGAMKFGAEKEVKTTLEGYVDWTITAQVKSAGDYGYAGAAMEFFDAQGKSLGVVQSKRPVVAKEWRKVSWEFSAPKSAKRYFVHLLSLHKEPVMFAKVQAESRQGVDKGDIPFEVQALPAEWNKDWNGGTVKMMSFSDAPLPLTFFLKGEKKGRKQLRLVVDVPAELEIKDAYCPAGMCYEALKPLQTLNFVTNGIDYVQYVFGQAELFMRLDAANFKVDEGRGISLVLGPKAGQEKMEKSFKLYYRLKIGDKRGEEKQLDLAFRPLPTNLRRAKNFPVFSWNNVDRHFASDAAANAAAKAYEAAGVTSYRRTVQGGAAFTRKEELAVLYEKRPVKYIFSGRFGDLWRLNPSGVTKEKVQELGVRMAVPSDKHYAGFAKGKMCPEYFTNDAKFKAHLREHVRTVLSNSHVKDGDWVTFDMEPWHSSAWCHCEECHKAFAAFAGLDHVPTAEETQTEALKDKWALFRCSHNAKSVAMLTGFIREYNPTLKCVDYDYIMPYGDEEGMKARRRACGKDTLVNEEWLDGHLCSYYHTIGKASFLALRNDKQHLKKFYFPMPALCGYGSYLRPGEVLSARQIHQFALAAFVNGCPGYAFYAGNCYDGEILLEMMRAQDEIAQWEDLPWGRVPGSTVATSTSDLFVFACTKRADGAEVVALFNYDNEDSICAKIGDKEYEIAPNDVKFVVCGK